MNNAFGAMGDPQFWSDVAKNATNPRGIVDTLKGYGSSAVEQLMQPAYRAGELSQQAFPNQAWDNTQRNALRHSSWMGGVAKALGASPDNPVRTPIAQGLAKLAGYGHEAVSALDDLKEGKQPFSANAWRDTQHDWNNNAVGIDVAGRTKSTEEMNQVLTQLALNARQGKPVSGFAFSDGQLSADRLLAVANKPNQASRPR